MQLIRKNSFVSGDSTRQTHEESFVFGKRIFQGEIRFRIKKYAIIVLEIGELSLLECKFRENVLEKHMWFENDCMHFFMCTRGESKFLVALLIYCRMDIEKSGMKA